MTAQEDPLLLPELLSKVLSFTDPNTLKASRLVCQFWNVQAGRILSANYWVRLTTSPRVENLARLEELSSVLATSADPSKFFGRLRIEDDFFPGEKLHQILETYGHCLKTLDYSYWHVRSNEDGPSYVQLFVYRVLTDWCPQLEELVLGYMSNGEPRLAYPIPSLTFKSPLNLRTIKTVIVFEIPIKFQDFLHELIKGCTKLNLLRVCRQDESNHRFYQKLTELEHVTKNLTEFTWSVDNFQDSTNIVGTFKLSNTLRKLRISYSSLNPMAFQVMINSISQNLTTIDLMNCDFGGVDTTLDFQAHIFRTVIRKLGNLETLNIGFLNTPHDHFFSNPDNLTDPPHTKLRRLLLPWACKLNLFNVSSLTNLVKWFPNLDLLCLCFGNEDLDPYDIGVGIKFHEAVTILSGLKKLKDLCLRICCNSARDDLQKTLVALQTMSSLQCCTLIEFGFDGHKTTYRLQYLQEELLNVAHLNFIRLIGFKFEEKESILEYAAEKKISLELYERYQHNFDIDDDFWLKTLTGQLTTDSFLV